MSSDDGILDLELLGRKVDEGVIETVLVVFPDLYGRLVGKRFEAQFFVDSVAQAGTHACDYLLTVDMEMEPVRYSGCSAFVAPVTSTESSHNACHSQGIFGHSPQVLDPRSKCKVICTMCILASSDAINRSGEAHGLDRMRLLATVRNIILRSL